MVDEPTTADTLPLAAVTRDGTVNLQPGSRTPSPEDTRIALIGPPAKEATATSA